MKAGRIFAYIGASVLFIALLSFLLIAMQQETQVLNEEARKQAPGRFISLPSGMTHYTLSGDSSGKLVVLIHGGGITGMEVWANTTPYLVEHGFRVLQYDLYGRGYSDRLQGDYTPERLLNQLVELMDALQLPDSLHVITMSMGSMVALDLATQYPGKVDKIVMLDPAITGDYRPSRLLQIPIVSDLLMTLYWYPRAVENQRKEFVDQTLFQSYSERLRYFMNFEGYKTMNHSTWMHTLNQDKSMRLSQLAAGRLLLVYGTRDPYFSEGNANKILSLYPTLQTTTISEAGHMPHFERPEETNRIMRGFLLGPN